MTAKNFPTVHILPKCLDKNDFWARSHNARDHTAGKVLAINTEN
jgi:hypothetical protein